jgi:hypothetical protein
MKGFCVGLVFLMYVLLFPTLAQADSIATLDLSVSGVPPDPSTGDALFGSGPTLFVTGQFVLDEDTSTISSWNMSFLGPLGATYQLSAQSGGVATAKCQFVPSCASITSPLDHPNWNFSFGNSIASLNVTTLFNEPLPFFTGETVQLCGAPFTIYPGGVIVGTQPCVTGGGATFDNQVGTIYQLPNGFSSGTLTVSSVVSTPEPSESSGLLLGLAVLFVCMTFKNTTTRGRGNRGVVESADHCACTP